jgi:preprotein translocase subunit SecE
MLNPVTKIRTLYQDTVSELKKCTWPTRAELIESTIVVIVSVLILGAFVFVTDMVSGGILKLIMVK